MPLGVRRVFCYRWSAHAGRIADRSTFIRHFKRAFRLAPSEYVQQVRLEEARTMLEATDLPVGTIAARTGFASRSHFSRMFRAAFGNDPSSHRERVRTGA